MTDQTPRPDYRPITDKRRQWTAKPAQEDLPQTLLARRFEAQLVHNYETAAGQKLSAYQRALLLDDIDKAVHAKFSGNLDSSGQELLDNVGYQSAARRAMQNTTDQGQALGQELMNRRGMEPMQRIAEWDDEARQLWDVGDRSKMPRLARRELDSRAAARVERRDLGEAYTRTDPGPRRQPIPGTRGLQIPRDPNANPPETLAQLEMSGANREIQASGHLLSNDTDNVKAGMARDLEGNRSQVSTYGLSRDQMMAAPRIDDRVRRMYGRSYADMPVRMRQQVMDNPEIQSLLSQSQSYGQTQSAGRVERNLGDAASPNKDYATRGDIPGPREFEATAGDYSTFHDNTIRQAAYNPRNPNDGYYATPNIAQRIRDAIKNNDLEAALQHLDDFDILHGEGDAGSSNLAIHDQSVANRQGQWQADAELQRTIDPNMQTRFRGPGSAGTSRMPGYSALSEPERALQELLLMLDPSQSGLTGAELGAKNPMPRYRREPIGMNLPDTNDLPDDPWAIDNEISRPPAGSQFDQANTRPTLRRGLPPDTQMPFTPEQVGAPGRHMPLTEPGVPATPDVIMPSEPPAVPEPFNPNTTGRPRPLMSEPSVGPQTQNFRPTNPVSLPDFNATRGESPFSSILENITRGRPSFMNALGSGLNALGLAGNIFDLNETRKFQDYITQQNLAGGIEDSTGRRVPVDPMMSTMYSGLSQAIPFLGGLLFDRERFKNDPAYRDRSLYGDNIPVPA